MNLIFSNAGGDINIAIDFESIVENIGPIAIGVAVVATVLSITVLTASYFGKKIAILEEKKKSK